jgi:predicted metal-dependent peptidase
MVEPVKVSLSDILCHLSNQGTFMFFSKVVSSLPVLRTKQVPIIGIQLTPHGYTLLVNEEGIDAIPSLEFLIMLIEHEVHHVVLEHSTRSVRKIREVTDPIEKQYARTVLQISKDLAVNDQLRNYSKHADQLLDKEMGGCVPGHTPYEKIPRGKMFEQYFDLIMKMALDERNKMKPLFDLMNALNKMLGDQSDDFKEGYAAGYRDTITEKARKQ